MVKKPPVTGAKPISRAKAMITVARQNASEILNSLEVDLGSGYTLSHAPKTEQACNFAFDLTKRNMRELYEAAPEWGWKDDEKVKEIYAEQQHLIAVLHNQQMFGFAAFRWLVEAGEPVLYLYEIQFIEDACRKGLGTKVMQVIERLAARTRMTKVVLTVLVGNVAAIKFYRKLGYVNNEKLPEKTSYRILSKKLGKQTDPDSISMKFSL